MSSVSIERRERQKLQLRRHILDAARKLLHAQGDVAVTIRRIAEAIEYSPTTIYLYFEDKEALLRELCRLDAASLMSQLESIAAMEDPLESLRQTGLAYVEFGVTHPHHYGLMFKTVIGHTGDAPASDPERSFYVFLEKAVGRCMTRGLFRKELDDVGEISQLLWAALHGLISLHLAKGDESWLDWRPSRHLAERMVDLQIRGLLRDSQLRSLHHVA
jgi:AcrR family transcriptional regulator